EAGEPLAHVVGEARLAQFAVVDAVDAALDLPAHGVGHRALQARRERVAVVRLPACPGDDHRPVVDGTRQAAGVGRETAVAAAYHGPPCFTCTIVPSGV